MLDTTKPSPADAPAEGISRGGRARRLAAAAGAGIRAHWLATALLTAGLVLRVVAGLAYRPALFYIDSARYLYNAGGMDPVGYKALLRPLLLVANFDAVAGVQHLLGLAMAVVIYLLLLRRGAPRWLAALAMAPVLLDAYQVQSEQLVMPTTLFEALTVAGLTVLLWRPAPGWRRIAAAGLVLGSSATVAQVGEALLFPALAFVVLQAAGGGWRRALAKAGALAGAFALPILAYCTVSYLASGAFYLSHTGVTSMYGRMAAAADCATLRMPSAERGMCPSPAQQANGPDWLEYAPGSPIRPFYRNLPIAQTDSMLADFNTRVLTQQPLRVLAAYGRDILKPYALTRTSSAGDPPLSRWQFQTAFPYYPPHASQQVVDGATARFGGGPPSVWRPAADALRAYQLGGGYTPGPLLAVFTLAGLAGAAPALRRRAGPATRQAALACLLLTGASLAVTLVADLFEFSWRYQLPSLVTLAPGGALGISLLIASARARRRPEPAGGDPPPSSATPA